MTLEQCLVLKILIQKWILPNYHGTSSRGSLSSLLRSKWGLLNETEGMIAYYTKQILEGLTTKKLSTGIKRRQCFGEHTTQCSPKHVKFLDFEISKRLVGKFPNTATFIGTLHYIVPESLARDRGSTEPRLIFGPWVVPL